MYDYLIVGAGLYGAVFAEQKKRQGKKCLVLERREHIAGNIYTKEIEGIDVHMYGPHIFHTNNEKVWNYINQFAQFNHFIYSPIANYRGRLYNLPFNMNTFSEMWGIVTPKQAQEIIKNQIKNAKLDSPQNLEEQAISLVGTDIYEKLIKGYTQKQWGRKCIDLPPFIIKRLPVRFTFDNNYFDHSFQGIPKYGYTKLIENILDGTEVVLGVDYLQEKDKYKNKAKNVVFTGPIDEYFNFTFGTLEYRSLRFETEVLDVGNYQGVAGMNYTDADIPYTRIVEHKHFMFGQGNPEKTVITKEFSEEWTLEKEPYYPVNDEKNALLYKKYVELSCREKNVLFGGRLGTYKYMDMDQVIAKALEDAGTEEYK